MGERSSGPRIDGGDRAEARARILDDGLLWLRPFHRRVVDERPVWWPGLDRELADLHARYERACVED